MKITLGHRTEGIHIGRWNIGDTIAYIENRSGKYDQREKQIIDDPYIIGFESAQAGKRLCETLRRYKARPRSGHEYVIQREALIKKGFRDGQNQSN